MSSVEGAAKIRQKRSKNKFHNAMLQFCLTELLEGSLSGSALTGMITCLSQSPRNGDETYLSLKYGSGMAKLLNAPNIQPSFPLDKLLATAKEEYAKSAAIVAKGVNGKYQALRQAEVTQWMSTVEMLTSLAGEK
jgi:hypothetical protein